MLQSVATLGSLLIAAGMLAVIAAVLADDWLAITGALGWRRGIEIAPLPTARRAGGDRRARVIAVSPQFTPRTAAA